MVTGENIGDLIAAADVAADDRERGIVIERLAALGVERLHAPPGVAFDPTLHRAVSLVPATSPADENTIDGTVRPGWRLGPDILRFVEVAVKVPPSRCPPRR
ncbi:nucleotide exchange factor GrpE [Rhodococcus phenolicus]|uniref:nucleotide exchange factor GrpE n=1 Tax=Rhodococcus phenolicus TaxID=263849 RepID=UPI00083528A9|nr:nucleotide exchange factor GrpE [Rhodococcus phenolicus]